MGSLWIGTPGCNDSVPVGWDIILVTRGNHAEKPALFWNPDSVRLNANFHVRKIAVFWMDPLLSQISSQVVPRVSRDYSLATVWLCCVVLGAVRRAVWNSKGSIGELKLRSQIRCEKSVAKSKRTVDPPQYLPISKILIGCSLVLTSSAYFHNRAASSIFNLIISLVVWSILNNHIIFKKSFIVLYNIILISFSKLKKELKKRFSALKKQHFKTGSAEIKKLQPSERKTARSRLRKDLTEKLRALVKSMPTAGKKSISELDSLIVSIKKLKW